MADSWQTFIIRKALLMNISTPLLKKEKEWLTHGKHLSKPEKNLLERFDELFKRDTTRIVFITSDPNSKAKLKSLPRMEQGFNMIKEMLESQLNALEKLRSDIERVEKLKIRKVKGRKK